jgi:hypothetical protein
MSVTPREPLALVPSPQDSEEGQIPGYHLLRGNIPDFQYREYNGRCDDEILGVKYYSRKKYIMNRIPKYWRDVYKQRIS